MMGKEKKMIGKRKIHLGYMVLPDVGRLLLLEWLRDYSLSSYMFFRVGTGP